MGVGNFLPFLKTSRKKVKFQSKSKSPNCTKFLLIHHEKQTVLALCRYKSMPHNLFQRFGKKFLRGELVGLGQQCLQDFQAICLKHPEVNLQLVIPCFFQSSVNKTSNFSFTTHYVLTSHFLPKLVEIELISKYLIKKWLFQGFKVEIFFENPENQSQGANTLAASHHLGT